MVGYIGKIPKVSAYTAENFCYSNTLYSNQHRAASRSVITDSSSLKRLMETFLYCHKYYYCNIYYRNINICFDYITYPNAQYF